MQSLPVFYVRADNYYDVGKEIGNAFKGWIGEYMASAHDMAILREFYNSTEGFIIYNAYLASSNRCYPNTVSELRGMADGSEQSFEDLFLLQIASEVIFCLQYEVLGHKFPIKTAVKGCTDILVNSDSARLIGHNDDWTDDVANRTYVVHVTIYDSVVNDNESVTIVKEEFISYAYPGSLPGFCFGMNKDLVITLNSLIPKKVVRGGVPLQILLRQLLTKCTIDDCVKIMENKPDGCAYGMNINIARVHDSDMCSMEVYPRETGTEVVLRQLPIGSSDNPDCILHHQNHYKYLHGVDEIDEFTVGSKRRENRVEELNDPTNVNDVRHILGDTTDELEPVFCRPKDHHIETNLMTSATAIFNITERRLEVYRSNPVLAAMPCLAIPFL